MAWHCSGKSNADLISNLVRAKIVTSRCVEQALRRVDRAAYVPSKDPRVCYQDAPQPIGRGATISAPHMHAYALEVLAPVLTPGARALDVGSGSGYLCAAFAQLVGENGKVVGIEHLDELVERSRAALAADQAKLSEAGVFDLRVGDGRRGVPEHAPYAAIHVGAAAPDGKIPDALLEQLKPGGRMIIPVEDEAGESQELYQVDKDDKGKVSQQPLMAVRYVMLADASQYEPPRGRSSDQDKK